MIRRDVLAGGLALIVTLALTTTVKAEDTPAPAPESRARGQQLFESALADAEAGNYTAACPKLLASHEADPKATTLFNLGNCYEKTGRTASAWGAFRDAETLARRLSKAEWERLAHQRAAALEPHLLRLTIEVTPEGRVEGLTVTRDGTRVPSGEWGVGLFVDPGDHAVVAAAPGFAPSRQVATVSADTRLVIPILARAPMPTARREEAHGGPAPRSGGLRTAGAITGGAGALGVVAGLALGLAARSYNASAVRACDGGTTNCPDGALRDNNTAYDLATAATISAIAGGALLVGGVALFTLSPTSTRTGSAATLTLGAGGLAAGGTF